MDQLCGTKDPYAKNLTRLENQIALFEKEQEHYEEALLQKDLLIKSQTNKIRELTEQTQRLSAELSTEHEKLDELLVHWQDTNTQLRTALEQARSLAHAHLRHTEKVTAEKQILEAELEQLRELNSDLVERLAVAKTVAADFALADALPRALNLPPTPFTPPGPERPSEENSDEEFPSFHDEEHQISTRGAVCGWPPTSPRVGSPYSFDRSNHQFLDENESTHSKMKNLNGHSSGLCLADELASSYDHDLRSLLLENERLTRENRALIRSLHNGGPTGRNNGLLAGLRGAHLNNALGPRSATDVLLFQRTSEACTNNYESCVD